MSSCAHSPSKRMCWIVRVGEKRCGERCGEVLGEVWKSVLGCGEGKKDVGRGVWVGRALNELMRSLTFRTHVLHCEGR